MESGEISVDILPLEVRIGKRTLTLDHFKPSQVTEAYELVSREAQRGQDVGVDEFPSPSCLLSHTQHAHSFSFTDDHSETLQAFLTLVPSDFSRSLSPLLVDGTIICHLDIRQEVIEGLINIGLALAGDLGYEGVLAEVYSNSDLVRRLRAEQFNVIGCIPFSGRLRGRGWTDSFIMYKDLKHNVDALKGMASQKNIECRRLFRKQVPSNMEVKTERAPGKDEGEKQECDDSILPIVPKLLHLQRKPPLEYFPCRYVLSSDMDVNFRYVEERDIAAVYALYRTCAERANGFSTDEFTTMELFRFYVIDHAHAIIAEDTKTFQLILTLSIIPSTLCRSSDPLLADGYLIVDPKYHNNGIGYRLSSLLLKISQDLGYLGVLTDVLVDNTPALRILRRLGFGQVGYIPKSAIDQAQKPKDLVIFYKGFDNSRTTLVAKL